MATYQNRIDTTMNIKARIMRLAEAMSGAERHTCGPIVFVDFDQEIPPLPPCAACKRLGRIRFVQFTQSRPAGESLADSHDATS
jgi:hypothetical protein